MDYVEASNELRAGGYARPLRYTVDRSLADRRWPFRYVYDQGGLRCSHAAEHEQRICYVARDTEITLAKERPSFVYVDVGCWADDGDGKGTRRRDFALVCGQHVYLCEYVGKPVVPHTRVPSVREFFTGLSDLGCGARVVQYARARNFDRKTWQDPSLYLLMGDLHLPPVAWFALPRDVAFPPPRDLPDWLARAPIMASQKDYLYHSVYDWVASQPTPRTEPVIRGVKGGHPDISGRAGLDFARFVRALCCLDPRVRQRLHFIQLGDLLEMWVGHYYQLAPGEDGTPTWRWPDSPRRVATWGLEVMLQNAPVFEELDRLANAGLAEVKYLGGNHDGYLMRPEITQQLALPPRDPIYRGLNGDLLAEHGHRFDGWNHDGVHGREILSGPFITFLLLARPDLRQLEGPLGKIAEAWSPERRDAYLLGATLLYLHERMELRKKPFSIYAMAHTHARTLLRFDIRTKYVTSNREEGQRGEVVP
jgi:hypothetical protein